MLFDSVGVKFHYGPDFRPPKIKALDITITNPQGPSGYYIDSADGGLYTL
jgi:hypothetical protein